MTYPFLIRTGGKITTTIVTLKVTGIPQQFIRSGYLMSHQTVVKHNQAWRGVGGIKVLNWHRFQITNYPRAMYRNGCQVYETTDHTGPVEKREVVIAIIPAGNNYNRGVVTSIRIVAMHLYCPRREDNLIQIVIDKCFMRHLEEVVAVTGGIGKALIVIVPSLLCPEDFPSRTGNIECASFNCIEMVVADSRGKVVVTWMWHLNYYLGIAGSCGEDIETPAKVKRADLIIIRFRKLVFVHIAAVQLLPEEVVHFCINRISQLYQAIGIVGQFCSAQRLRFSKVSPNTVPEQLLENCQ